ncbi:unnamed protein product, partial [Gulo gulo]
EFLDLVPADFLRGESQGLVCEEGGNLDPWLLLAPGWGVGEPLPAGEAQRAQARASYPCYVCPQVSRAIPASSPGPPVPS